MMDEIPPELSLMEIHSCCDQGCKFKMQNVNNYAVFKGEVVEEWLEPKPKERKPACDCMIFYKGKSNYIVLAELKSCTVDVENLVSKFCGSKQRALHIHSMLPSFNNPEIFFVLLARGY